MSKLLCAFALAVSLTACVDDDTVGTPPQTADDGSGDETQGSDDRVPIDLHDKLSTPQCANFDGKGDGPCAP